MRPSVLELVNQEMDDVFIEFYRLDEILKNQSQHIDNYVIIRLVTVIEQFFRKIIEYQIKKPVFLDKISSELKINKNVFMKMDGSNKERLIASTFSLQNVEEIVEKMNAVGIKNVFKLKPDPSQQNKFKSLFALRHGIVHSVLSYEGNIREYYDSTKYLMQSVLGKIYNSPNPFYVNSGNAYATLHQYKMAIKCYDEAIKLDLADATPHINKGIVLNTLGKLDDAIKCFDMAIKLDSTISDSYIQKGFSLLRRHNDNDALKCFNDAIDVNKMSKAYAYKAGILASSDYHEEALPCYDKAIAVDPTDPILFKNKAHSLMALHKDKDARDYLSIAISRFARKTDFKSTMIDIYVDMGYVLLGLGEHDEAIKNLDEALRIDPNNSRAHSEKGYVLRGQGKYDKAKKSFSRAIKLDPEYIYGHIGLLQSLEHLDRYKEALEHIEKMTKINLKDATVDRIKNELIQKADNKI